MNQNIIVNESSANLRALGRDALRGNWKLGVAGTLLYMILVYVPMDILNAIFGNGTSPAGISMVYIILISGPMALGYAMFAISIFRKRETSPAEVFYGFERFGKALGLLIVIIIFVTLWSLLFIVPGIIAAFRYSMSFYILADNPDMGIMEALNESKRMMQGNKWKFFCLNLSFIGWMLLAIIPIAVGTGLLFPFVGRIDYVFYSAIIDACGIGYLWITPYMEVSTIAFYDIANGSLRSVRTIEGDIDVHSDNNAANFDPITVYKDGPETTEENREVKIIESGVPAPAQDGKS